MRENTDILEQFRRKDRNRTGYHFISDERFNSLTIGIRKRIRIHLGQSERASELLKAWNMVLRGEICVF